MEDVVAVPVALADGGSRYFLTWGRVGDPLDEAWVAGVVLRAARRCDLGGTARTAEVCWSLQEAAAETYFYESFWGMCRQAPTTRDHGWRERTKEAMQQGREIWYLGRPRSE